MPYVVSFLCIVLGVPLALRMVEPNRWYGVRTSKTLDNTQLWFDINALGGKSLIVAGILSIIVLVAVQILLPNSPIARGELALIVPLVSIAGALLFLFVAS